ncbi:MAG: baseplate J/gp47 family protein [Lachnospiraceae bacterium]
MSTTYEELLQAMLDKVPSNVDKREGSIIYDALSPCAYFLTQQTFQLTNFLDLVFADTAMGEYLDLAVSAYGLTRKPATATIREMITSAPVDIGTRWGISGLVYAVTTLLSEGIYAVGCETIGEIGNQYSGTMEAISNISGISAELSEIITAGTDEETDEALRQRFYLRVQLPATSGNAYHYQQWALEVSGVGAVKVFPLDNGPGTVTVLIVNNSKEADPSMESAVAEYIETVRPIGADVTVSSPEETEINVSAALQMDGTKSLDTIITAFKEALIDYLKGLVFAEYRVSLAKIGSLLLAADGVLDYENLMVNNARANVVIGEKAIPVLGTLSITEV